jgi:hypothetical protein
MHAGAELGKSELGKSEAGKSLVGDYVVSVVFAEPAVAAAQSGAGMARA